MTPEQKICNYETLKHIMRVRDILDLFVKELLTRGSVHDKSKMESPELELFTEYTPLLANTTFNSPEYNELKEKLSVALEHHYANNSHHPEFIESHEDWKDIDGYIGLYKISNRGRIKSCDKTIQREKQGNFNVNEKILKPSITPDGYARIQLSKNNEKENIFIHVLVANAFIPNIDTNKTQVNHKDGNKLHNNVSNLEWVTPEENLKHAYDNGLKNAHIKYIVTCNELDITTFGIEKMKSALHKLGYNKVCSAGIWSCITKSGKVKSHAGFTFSSMNIQDYQELNSPINDMTLLDIVEMFADWKAASERHNNGNLLKSIESNCKRFNMSEQLIEIFENTAKKYFT